MNTLIIRRRWLSHRPAGGAGVRTSAGGWRHCEAARPSVAQK
jgi:hypothetical protein